MLDRSGGRQLLYTFKHIRPRSLSDAAAGDNRDASGVVTIDRQSPPPTNTPPLTLTITWARVAAAHIARWLLSDAAANDVGTWPWPRGSENTAAAAAMMPGIYEAATYVCAPDRRCAVWRSINPPPTATHHPYDIRPTHTDARDIVILYCIYLHMRFWTLWRITICKYRRYGFFFSFHPSTFPRLPPKPPKFENFFFFRREWKHVIISLPTYYVTTHIALQEKLYRRPPVTT